MNFPSHPKKPFRLNTVGQNRRIGANPNPPLRRRRMRQQPIPMAPSQWMQSGDYAQNRRLSNLARLRAEEIAIYLYPYKAEGYLTTHVREFNSDRHRELLDLAMQGRAHVQPQGRGRQAGRTMESIISLIQTKIMEYAIAKYGQNIPDIAVRQAKASDLDLGDLVCERPVPTVPGVNTAGGFRLPFNNTVGAKRKSVGWNTSSGYNSLEDWLHEYNDRYYQPRREMADLAMRRAEELAAIQYPVSAKKELGRGFDVFIKEGMKRINRTGKSGKVIGNFYAVVRKIQQMILSNLLEESGGKMPDEMDVRCAGLDTEGISKAPCSAYKPKTVGRKPNIYKPERRIYTVSMCRACGLGSQPEVVPGMEIDYNRFDSTVSGQRTPVSTVSGIPSLAEAIKVKQDMQRNLPATNNSMYRAVIY